jgi:hypothetical protein
MRVALALTIAVACTLTARADETAPSRDFALSGCRVITAAGDDIPDGVVVVKGGKIAAVGAREGTKVPRGVRVVDAGGKVVSPAFVHVASRIGLRGNGGGGSSTTDPAKTVADELNPWLEPNRWAAATGFATLGLMPGQGIVGGRGAAVRAGAADLESMTRREDAFLRVDVTQGTRFVGTLAGQLSIGRKDLDAHAKWKREHAEWQEKKKAAEAAKKKPPAEPKEPKLNESRSAYHKVLRGEMALLCLVGSSSDVVSLSEALADEAVRGNDLRLVCMLTGDSFRAASQLLDLDATCVVRAGLTSWPNTTQTICPAVYLRNAGLRVVLLPKDDNRGGLRDYTYDLARVIEAGFPRDDAWRAATADAATVLGVQKTTGTIEKDRGADLILWSGDPLLATSRLEQVWIDGTAVEDTP